MQYRNHINKVTGGLMYSLLLAFAPAAFAGDKVISQQIPDYSFQLIDSRSNPWALPQVDEQSKFQLFRGQQGRPQQHQGSRFVTPEILESLKQQQMMYQRLPGDRLINRGSYGMAPQQRRPVQDLPVQNLPAQTLPAPPVYGLSVPGATGPSIYAPPMYNMPNQGGYSNPMIDVPSVSPWGNGSDLLQRGGSFPWMPDAAVGGLPPIHVQPFMGNQGGTDENRRLNDRLNPLPNNVFNPFSFGPNGNL